MKGIHLERLNWPEAENAFASDPVVLMPIGARCKEHGPHLPLNTDWVQAEYFTERVSEHLPVLVLPTVQFGYYPAFVDYPGTTHLESDTFYDVLLQICHSLSRHGIRRIYSINMGISTLPALEALQNVLAEEGVAFRYCDPGNIVLDLERELEQQPRGSHADEMETSVMLAIAPELVNMEKAPREIGEYHGRGPFRRKQHERPGLYSPSGIWGDAGLATAEKGERLVEAIVNELVREIGAWIGDE